MDVKTAARVLDLFEAFAALGRPASLSELARRLDIPVSSCFGLLRTIENRGYLYSLKPRGGVYPTKRLLQIARSIAAHDPVAERVAPILTELRDATGETAVLAKRSGARVLYLDVVESDNRIRYTAEPGEIREMHSNSIGKVLLAFMPDDERDKLIDELTYTRLTPATLTTRRELEADLAKIRERGWSQNFGESVSDVWALAVPVTIAGDLYGISLVGPMHRVKPAAEKHLEKLREACRAIEALDAEA